MSEYVCIVMKVSTDSIAKFVSGFALVSLLIAPVSVQAALELNNALWRIELDPASLALQVKPAHGEAVRVSDGSNAYSVSELMQTNARASWQWNGGAYRFEVELKGRDLLVSISARSAGELVLLRQPAVAVRKGLILPLAEGRYVPVEDKTWKEFLLKDFSEFNTSQDISLPLWGIDEGNVSLSWLLTNPFNNTVKFTRDGDGIALSLSHDFTKLDPHSPMTLILHLGEADPLAGAKRYRDWLIAEGKYETLSGKIAKAPEGEKLIGASHVYLWGSGLLSVADVADWPAFVARLKGDDTLAARLRGHFQSEAQRLLAAAKPPFDRYHKRVLIEAVNGALNALARESWQIDAPNMNTLAGRYGELREEVARVFAGVFVSEPSRWGGGISMATMETLRAAGLPRLWIGLGEGWEAGLWHPEAVAAAVKAGYLVAPYDSYETALKSGDNPDWATAHLGAAAYRGCSIVLKDGTTKAGFQNSGHYTDPDCVRPLMQARVKAVAARVPFNSWFLDAYASGMVFDSYRSGAPVTQAQAAAGYTVSASWISEKLGLPTGSEDGNATTARGILFAHGMQTPVIGWGDKDMREDKASSNFVGAWYPSSEPAVFFKPVPIKALFRTIYFDPATRLPLYQAVFHGSVITTHHWLFDSLKFTNVRAENELAQLLYNVPPLYHLSSDTLKKRIAIIKRQDAFFRPLHRKLAMQALTSFRWLSSDHQLQETAFSEGTRLIANFSGKDRTIGGRHLPARSLTVLGSDGTVGIYWVAAD
ncbi:glycoside hydrolase [Burkholderia pseudomallei]|uniref:glycoside hydrolase n=1 Tax=Burkholderia pseudomallei TaxID=28450 RepID=UPI00014F98B3|nr:glycoside hydrolase [Burkholderia pseudomallei]AGR68549.1 glycosyl hydrolase [Burkholderia pseudomallei MSHR305]AHK67489.1 glycosyl hydrolases related to GH101 family protein [Burkholderia pseudomallei MSHR520]AIP82463.1 glycosyl hydrolase [Burkholderia pseudomallei]EBA49869.1 conserved hypothetical protein [Burkholderia pseudomallei 305]KGV96016.1 glycosyl hydrolase [Burkholderia pseudomallei ABCPW 30]